MQRVRRQAASKPYQQDFHAGKVASRFRQPAAGNLLQLFELQEQVAQRLANRLHDECSQMLATIYLALAEIAGDCPRATASKIDGVVRDLDSVGEQLRSLSHELRPLVLDRYGLVPALNLLVAGVRKRAGLTVVLTTAILPPLDRMTETALYRIVQEALSNILRHAGASRAEVTLRSTAGFVQCTIADDGCGFAAGGETGGSGLGLLGIRERIAAMHGRLDIKSAPGQGSILQVELPL